MDIGILSHRHALEIVLAIGDNPGQTLRRYITVPNKKDGAPSNTAQARIAELEGAGIIRFEGAEYRGKPITRVYLTDVGTTVYQLLCIIRGL